MPSNFYLKGDTWNLNTTFGYIFCRIDAFQSSDQGRCASKLLSAYAEGDLEEIKCVAQSSSISNLDHMVCPWVRLHHFNSREMQIFIF